MPANEGQDSKLSYLKALEKRLIFIVLFNYGRIFDKGLYFG
jgi:hypothetical protein